MNLAEKLAGTYLRLNGFLALGQFTAFDGKQHNHIDIVAFRAPNSQELVDGISLITDDLLFDSLSDLVGYPSRTAALGIAAEVRTNEDRDEPSDAHIEYVEHFLGGLPIIRLAFFDGPHAIKKMVMLWTLACAIRACGFSAALTGCLNRNRSLDSRRMGAGT